jgi:quinol monooxygenase YgiN
MNGHKSKSRGKSVKRPRPIHFRAEFIIPEGKTKEYKKLIKEMSKLVEANEPDTIGYQFYFDKSETRCIVHETYTNLEAVFAHIDGVASSTVKVNNICQFAVV